MTEWRLTGLAREVGGELRGTDRGFSKVSTDTRSLEQRSLFVALKGPNFDGCDFIDAARERGASGALVERFVDSGLPQVRVADTLEALGQFAHAHRLRFGIPIVAVTGTNGKTTVKNMLARILEQQFKVLATEGNLNNEIGVPLTLLSLRVQHEAAVVELGANHAGEIGRLTAIVDPSVGLVTNATAAHLEGFGSVEGVARSKGELFEQLDSEATAVNKADEVYCEMWQALVGDRRMLTFGSHPGADFRISGVSQETDNGQISVRFTLHTPDGTGTIRIPLAGAHNALNAAAATAAAWAIGADFSSAVAGLRTVAPAAGRLEIFETIAGARLINDSYNANPTSLTAAIQFLVALDGEPWVVIGDMGELGEHSERWHTEIGARAHEYGVRRLFGVGTLARRAVDAFGSGGEWFEDIDVLTQTLKSRLRPDVNLLVKGSRMMRLERVVADLVSELPAMRQVNGD